MCSCFAFSLQVNKLCMIFGSWTIEEASEFMSYIMTSPLALEFNWLEEGGKRGFSSLKLKDAVCCEFYKSTNYCQKHRPMITHSRLRMS